MVGTPGICGNEVTETQWGYATVEVGMWGWTKNNVGIGCRNVVTAFDTAPQLMFRLLIGVLASQHGILSELLFLDSDKTPWPRQVRKASVSLQAHRLRGLESMPITARHEIRQMGTGTVAEDLHLEEKPAGQRVLPGNGMGFKNPKSIRPVTHPLQGSHASQTFLGSSNN